MNKTKKIAIAAVSLVMAGTIAMSVTACGGGEENTLNSRSSTLSDTRFNASGSAITTKTVGGLSLAVSASDNTKLAYSTGTNINVNIIDSGNVSRAISYDSTQIASYWTGLDGYDYQAGDLKPAWWQFGQTLGIKFNDVNKSGRSGSELSTAVSQNELASYTMLNASVSQISQNTTSLLDISQYLDYMPNYKAFLEANPIVQLSLTMDANGAMYNIPYFDGNDDIEKYNMVQRSWVKTLLDDAAPATDTSVTYKAQVEAKTSTIKEATASTSTAVESFMGTSGSWVVETTDPSDSTKTLYVKCDYDAVKSALANSASGLATAVAASGVTVSATDSGNIVDIMNAVINGKSGEVKGSVLVNILKEYIKVAYYYGSTADAAKTSTNAFYGAKVNGVDTKLSDVFVSSYAAWDADLLTAIFRCVCTNYVQLTGSDSAVASEVYALAAREMKAQRQNDLISLAGELYGVRGLESRLDYTYVDANGKLQSATLDTDAYDAAARLNNYVKEGLMYNVTGTKSSTVNKTYKAGSVTTFMLHDYAQTQTTDGFSNSSFDFAPILTPVSKWDDNSNGSKDTVMRFTESWRSVKNTGVCIPTAAVQDPEVLSAVLSFIDYLYSNDGQIVGSYGPMSTVGNTASADGFWYGNPVTATIEGVSISNGVLSSDNLTTLASKGVIATNDGVQYYVPKTSAYYSKYFMYNNVLYTGTDYNGRQIPTMTDNNMNFFLGKEVNGNKMSTDNEIGYTLNHATKYTDYARGVVGAALPIGNKDQGFEYQCTAKVALDGANIVNEALQNGTIQHVTQQVDSTNYWYTESASCLPTTTSQASTIKNQTYLDGSSKAVGIYNPTSTAGYTNIYIDLAFYGYKDLAIGTMGTNDGDYKITAKNATELIAQIRAFNNDGLSTRVSYYQEAWQTLLTYYKNSTQG